MSERNNGFCGYLLLRTSKGPLPEATPTESDRRILSDSVGFGQILIIGKFGRIRSDLVCLVGFGQTSSDLVGIGRILILGKLGWVWSVESDLVGFGRIWSGLVGF